jgi:hypothetical protein
MTDIRWWRALGVVLVPVAVAGLAACSGNGSGSGNGESSEASSASAAVSGFSAAQLRGALLTRVNGVAAVTAVSTGEYASLPAATTGRPAVNVVKVSPPACAGAASARFGSAILAGAPAAAVTFRLGGNAVSEVLIASSADSASAVLAGRVPAGCARYQGTVAGKTVNYGLTEKAVTGIGRQARELHVRVGGATPANQWSLVYRGAGFIGTVTVTGPNASEAAVRELAQQAYAFAARSLA